MKAGTVTEPMLQTTQKLFKISAFTCFNSKIDTTRTIYSIYLGLLLKAVNIATFFNYYNEYIAYFKAYDECVAHSNICHV